MGAVAADAVMGSPGAARSRNSPQCLHLRAMARMTSPQKGQRLVGSPVAVSGVAVGCAVGGVASEAAGAGVPALGATTTGLRRRWQLGQTTGCSIWSSEI